MALATPTVLAAILSASEYRDSKTFPWIASAVATAFVQWVRTPSAVLLTGNAQGFLGGGTVTGKFFLQKTGVVAAGMAASGFSVSVGASIGEAIETGLVSAVKASAQYQGTSAGVGTGTDVTRVQLSNQAVLNGYLNSALQAAKIQGVQAPKLARALSTGIANLVRTGYGYGVVAGGNTGLPGTGATVSFIL